MPDPQVGPDLQPVPPAGGASLSDLDQWIAPALRGEAIPAPAAPSPAGTPAATAPAALTPPTPGAAPPGGAEPSAGGGGVLDVSQLMSDYRRYRAIPAMAPVANQILTTLTKMVPEGWQLNPDGSIVPRAGLPQGTAAVAGAKAEAEEGPKRVTAAVAPQKISPGETVTYPPGSPLAAAPGAPGGGPATPTPGALTPSPGGGAVYTGPPGKGVSDLADADMDAANKARQGLENIGQLRTLLVDQMKNTGPGAAQMAKIDQIAQLLHVPEETRATFGLPSGVAAAEAEKLSRVAMGNLVASLFPKQRITNMELGTYQNAVPNIGLPQAANKFLIDQSIVPQLWQNVDLTNHMIGNRAAWRDEQTYQQAKNDWLNAHPLDNYVKAMSGRAEDEATRPAPQALPPAAGPGAAAAPPAGAAPGAIEWDRETKTMKPAAPPSIPGQHPVGGAYP
jgi:hypothetical protein